MPRFLIGYRVLNITLLFVLIFTSLARAQEELTRTFVSPDNSYRFDFPEGWRISTQDSLITLTSPDSDIGSVLLLFFDPPLVSEFLPRARSAEAVVAAIGEEFDISGDIGNIELGEREAAVAQLGRRGDEGLAVAIEFSDGGYGLVVALGSVNSSDDFRDTVVAIISTFDTPDAPRAVNPLRDALNDRGGSMNLPARLDNLDGEWEDVVRQLEDLQIIASGGTLIFEEDYAYFSGRGNFATPLARHAPQTDIIMAGELTYRNGGTAEYENCALMSRIVVENDLIVKGLEVGLDNDGDLYYYDLYGSGRDSFHANILKSNIDLDESHHILFIASGNELTVYFDGDQVIASAEINARSGIYGISLNGKGSSAQCEGRNIWVYHASRFEAGVCTISASSPVNKRTGPGTNFAQAGRLSPSTTLEAIAQAEDAGGFTWWKLEDDTWVREDVVQAAGDCRSLPQGD